MSDTNITHDPSSPAWSYYLDNTQSFNLTTLNGGTLNLSLIDVDEEIYYKLVANLFYGFSIGAIFITVIVQIMYWDFKKSKKPLFIINFVALIFQFCRMITVTALSQQQLYYGVGEYFIGAWA